METLLIALAALIVGFGGGAYYYRRQRAKIDALLAKKDATIEEIRRIW